MSKLYDVAAAVKTTTETVLTNEGVTGTVSVNFDPIVQEPGSSMTSGELRVYVVPLGIGFVERSNRGQDRHAYEVGLMWVRKLTPSDLATAAATLAAVDADITFIRASVYKALTANTYAPVTGATLNDAEITTVCDRGVLREYGILKAELVVSYWLDESN